MTLEELYEIENMYKKMSEASNKTQVLMVGLIDDLPSNKENKTTARRDNRTKKFVLTVNAGEIPASIGHKIWKKVVAEFLEKRTFYRLIAFSGGQPN